jgi:CubicO group peptidase (beta-lactamase class C family)
MKTPVSRIRPERARRDGVNSDNWIDGPFNRWGFRHVRELTGTARITRGNGPVRVLPERQGDLHDLVTSFGHESFRLAEALEATYSDAFVVTHDGEIVYEWYAEGMAADDTHLLMSVSKSLTSTLIGALVGERLVDPEEAAHAYVPALCGTAWEGATVQHLLDMSAGVEFDESDYDDPESAGCLIEQISGYTTHRRPDLPADTAAWIVRLPAQGVHGDRFEYRSIITDVLAWVAEAVTGQRFADVFADRIWSRVGAEQDADIIVDAVGFPTVEGGICCTARDLARIGLLHLERGMVGGTQVIPAAWTDRILSDDPVLRAYFAAGDAADPANPKAYYHDCWWVIDAALGRYKASGINGQHLWVDRSTKTVIAHQSTWPNRMEDDLYAFDKRLGLDVLTHFAR